MPTEIHLRLQRGYKLHDQRSWDVFLGAKCEGSITWYRDETDLGAGVVQSPGYHWLNWHCEGSGGPFPTLRKALRDMERFYNEVLLNAD